MKRGVDSVNTARGQIIDEAALAIELEEGHVAAVGLDVFEHEPEVHPCLIKYERALLVPHMGLKKRWPTWRRWQWRTYDAASVVKNFLQ